MGITAAVLFGVVGGLIAEFYAVQIHRRTAKGRWPEYVGYWYYWAFGVGWVAIGGFLAGVYEYLDGTELNAILAMNVGATAPLIVEGLMRATPDLSPGTGG